MKKLLLLSALLICACSSEDSNENNNSPAEKKLLSIELYSLLEQDRCFEWTNASFQYEGEKIDRVDYQYLQWNGCYGNYDYYYDDAEYKEYLHLENKIIYTRSYDGVVQEIPTNLDGTAYGSSFNDEGYINGDSSSIQFEWSAGNLINIVDNEGTFQELISYSEINDVTGFLGLSMCLSFAPLDVDAVSFCQMGLSGRGTAKLPSRIIYNSNDDNGQIDYSYTLDDDGYPIYIYIDYALTDGSIGVGQQATLKLTYTN